MGGCDQVDTLHQKTYPGLGLRPRTVPRARGKNIFFMMDDAVSSAAGAERPDVFSEMTACCLTSAERAEAWGALSSIAPRWVLNPK